MKTTVKIMADITLDSDVELALDDQVRIVFTGTVSGLNVRRPFSSRPFHKHDPVCYVELDTEGAQATLTRLEKP